MKILFISNLFPNINEPSRGVFNLHQIRNLKQYCEVKVVAPIHWFPFTFSGRSVPEKETIEGIEVYHPRAFYIPKIFRSAYGIFFYWSTIRVVKKISREFQFDVIFGSWVYPDGYAAMKLADAFGKPLVIKAHGTDINVYAKSFSRRLLIKKVLTKADKVIAVSKKLKDVMTESLGVEKK